MRPAFDLTNLDLAKLTANERKLLETTNTKPNIAGTTGILVVVIQTVFLIVVWSKNPEQGQALLGHWAYKNVVYLPLAIWALGWSRIAIALLLAWHVISYWEAAMHHRMGLMMLFWWPALTYLLGLIGASSRLKAYRKAFGGNRR